MKDEYGIPLDKPWREVRFYDEYDEHLQPIGEPMNLMDWQAHLQSELGMARLKIRNLEEELELAHTARRIAMGLFTKEKADNAAFKESAYLADVAFQSLKEHHEFHFGKLEAENASLQTSYGMVFDDRTQLEAKLAAHLENEGDECPLCKLEEELNTLQQGYLGRGDAIKILHSWIMEDKNKIGELEQEIKERDQSFDLYHAASMRGIKMWQKATGKDMEWPDQGHLIVWLIAEITKLREAFDKYGKHMFACAVTVPHGGFEMKCDCGFRKTFEDLNEND